MSVWFVIFDGSKEYIEIDPGGILRVADESFFLPIGRRRKRRNGRVAG